MVERQAAMAAVRADTASADTSVATDAIGSPIDRA